MMMLGPDKKITQVILGKLKGQGGPELPAPPSASDDASAGLEAAVRKLFSCMKSDDVKGGVSALSEFLEMNEPSEQDEGPEESPQGA